MDEMKRDFEEQGFVAIRGMFTEAETAAFKAECNRLLEQHSAHAGVFVGLAANSPLFRSLARDARLVDALELLLGPNIEFLSDKVVFKSSSMATGSPWHQDWPYWEGLHKISVWISLDTATPENGCLKMLPGSHKQVAVHDGVAGTGEGFGHRLRPEAVDESKAVILPCAPGDAILFHDLTLHASFPNVSGQDRWSVISTYRSASEPDLVYSWSVAKEIVRGKALS
ncbi:MAG: Phytanoyl-CoA dioxygenase [Chthonomonadales bacterium]|nr:Phytanoyl-CoA dioxygenase [Chthonomonadales bacterium]